jgi:diguanylate cyclase (GGDEF)-like protein
MSFRTRLTSFFVLIVVVPMIAVAFLVFRLISDSEQGKADARVNGLATAAASLYTSQSAGARAAAQTVARNSGLLTGRALHSQLAGFAAQAGLARVTLTRRGHVIADVGDHAAVAPGVATVRNAAGGAPVTVRVSTVTASEFARDLGTSPDVEVVVRQGSSTLYSTLPGIGSQVIPRRGSFSAGGHSYRVVTQAVVGFGPTPVRVTMLSDLSATSSSVGTSRIVAAIFIVGFLLLAFSFSILASRALEGQIRRFLDAARRLGGGDFSSSIPTEGNDEFAALGAEFNSMSTQLKGRLDELSQERGRLRESIRRIGETFASNLDRPALLELALKTALDAVHAEAGRLTARSAADEPLSEIARVGSLTSLKDQIFDAERTALAGGSLGDAASDRWNVVSIALGPLEASDRARGVITVSRTERPFSDDDREVLRSLAAQATLALENIELHHQVQRQAVTDELTSLANHGHFQDLLSAEVEEVRRYHYPVGLIMLDIDDFKSINDTYGHQQGDVVLKQVAKVLRDTSRDVDTPARYGGEEMALILPHTDLGGAYAIAERLRTSISALRIPRLDGEGFLSVTASLGVTATSDGVKDSLIREADAALYGAKRQGKNQTVKAQPTPANVFAAE